MEEEQKTVKKLCETIEDQNVKIIELESTVKENKRAFDKIADYITDRGKGRKWKLQCSDVS